MSCNREEKQWSCGKPRAVNLQRVTSMVREIGEPCLSQSPIKVSRMLKREKWQATFDGDGKVSGFRKVLKSIVLGGVDPSIRAEVWEFLLGCYALESTAECRKQLRLARRERYEGLVKQCQAMHSSIGTGALAYVVGSKVMDVRTSAKDDVGVEAISQNRETTDILKSSSNWNGNCLNGSYACERESSSDSAEIISERGSNDSTAYSSSYLRPDSGAHATGLMQRCEVDDGSHREVAAYFDFPSLPVTNLFEKVDDEDSPTYSNTLSASRELMFHDESMHSFQINNNDALIMETNGSRSRNIPGNRSSEIEIVSHDGHKTASWSSSQDCKGIEMNGLTISGIQPLVNSSHRGPSGEDRISEWLWTLHGIVVDVVRTDIHLEFYEDKKNLARMSDILAVYAWIDPATGYCQGMSDLLSPFVVLFEDDADAFWCFEMLLRRRRENFQMEGPTGVMKQLQALWHILEVSDREIYAHLSRIGAESLHFAFRMLMVLFRRELSFSETLRMWEMMWAADFDESVACNLEKSCLEALVLHLPQNTENGTRAESTETSNDYLKENPETKLGHKEQSKSEINGAKSSLTHPLCGFPRNFWSKGDPMEISTFVSSTKNGDDELPVFCVAAILILNRHKIIKETRSFEDMIKIFNDNMLKIHVKRCIRTAIKLRKKYFSKLIKRASPTQNGE
ncbi:Rab GTPase-activating protein 22 [Linum grandiflorum]